MLRPTTVTGYVRGSGRYIGIVRAKVADATDENVSITDFMAWAREIEVQLNDKNAEPNSVFLRYATRVKPDRDKAEKPVNILLDLTEEALRELGFAVAGTMLIRQTGYWHMKICVPTSRTASSRSRGWMA